MEQTLEISKILEKDIALQVRSLAESIEEPRWFHRDRMAPGRAIDGASCKYDFCGHKQMSKETKEFLKDIAPKFENYRLAEIAINRYKQGDYLGKHKDRDYYRKNLVISLQEQGDGLYIDDEDKFVEDVTGQGVCINGIGPTHSVPEVKKLRYTLIYLYEWKTWLKE